MAITVTDQGTAQNTTTSTLAKAPAANIAAGDLVCVFVTEAATAAGASVVDSAGNTYTKAGSAFPNNSSANGTSSLWYSITTSGVTTGGSITYNKNGTGATEMTILSANSGGGAWSIDINLTPTTGSSTTPSVGPGTPAVAGELFVGAVGISGGAAGDTYTQPGSFAAPFTAITQSGGGKAAKGGNWVNSGTSATTYNPTITSRTWCAFLVSFKVATSAVATSFGVIFG